MGEDRVVEAVDAVPPGGDEDADLPGDGPWAMQLVLRDDRPDRPTHLAACAAAASAVVTLLADPRAVDGPWTEHVERWSSGPIRKIVRRGRGVRFAATGELDHVEVSSGGAVVRAFVPGPVRDLPPQLSKLQVAGTDLPDAGEPAPATPGAVTVLLTPEHPLTTGKAAAQCGHAAHLAWLALQPPELAPVLDRWRASGLAVRVLVPARQEWRRALRRAPVVVRDGGYTEVRPGTLTAVACWD